MKNRAFLKREAVNWLFIVMPFIYILLVYDRLPDFRPFRFEKEQIMYQYILFMMGVGVVWYIILLVRPSVVPRTPFHNHLKSYHRIRTIMLGFISLLSMTFISEKTGIPFNWSKIGIILSMVFIMVIGNLYPTIRYNYMIGIKNSWTRSSDVIWKKTHSFAGKVTFWGGLIGALYGIIFDVNPVPYMPVIYVGYVFILILIPKVYSYLLYRKLHAQDQILNRR
jgi:uncharacterized membrane protein